MVPSVLSINTNSVTTQAGKRQTNERMIRLANIMNNNWKEGACCFARQQLYEVTCAVEINRLHFSNGHMGDVGVRKKKTR